jgi:PE family
MSHDFSAHAATIHEQFVTTLATSARSYQATAAANGAAAG